MARAPRAVCLEKPDQSGGGQGSRGGGSVRPNLFAVPVSKAPAISCEKLVDNAAVFCSWPLAVTVRAPGVFQRSSRAGLRRSSRRLLMSFPHFVRDRNLYNKMANCRPMHPRPPPALCGARVLLSMYARSGQSRALPPMFIRTPRGFCLISMRITMAGAGGGMLHLFWSGFCINAAPIMSWHLPSCLQYFTRA